MKKIFYTLLMGGSAFFAQAQTSWTIITDSQVQPSGERTIVPGKYKVMHLQSSFKTLLFSASDEKNTALKNSSVIIELPMPDGSMELYKVVQSPVMAPELAAKFLTIRTFNVQGITDPGTFGKLDWTEFGFHAMIRKPAGDIFIDPYCRTNTSDYITYYTSDFKKDRKHLINETNVIDPKKGKTKETVEINHTKSGRAGVCAGEELRTYRLAIACTGEYAQAATGLTNPSSAQTLSAVVTTVNRVDGVYETEVAVKLVLIGNEEDILFTDPVSDPFAGNDDGGILIGESQTVIDNVIGSGGYDIGHTFSTGGGGLAYLGCVCVSGIKASAITGGSYPVGDAYDIDYVAHEMGHQFGGNHTFACFTGSCNGNGNPATQVEPGSGVTIMAYAGICDYNDLAPHSIAYFQTINFDEIMDFTTYGDGSSCPVVTTTANHPPVVTAPVIYRVPLFTPFILTGSATDIDGDALTYQWEETDNGIGGDWNGGDAPYFRSYVPTTDPSRMFPKLSVVLSGNYTGTIGEYVPSMDQTLNFRLIARDNKMGGGGVCYEDAQVIIDYAGPLSISYPNTTGITWASGSSQTVTWNVNYTNIPPVNCTNVNILVSTDGGTTFTMLLANTPNDGTQLITAPLLPVTKTTCRIKVESVGNIFFDINDKDFTITAGTTGINEYSASNGLAVSMVPNPFNEELQISFAGLNKELKSTLQVYDVLGNTVLTDAYTGTDELSKKYDVSFLCKGVYFVQIANEKQRVVSKLMKE